MLVQTPKQVAETRVTVTSRFQAYLLNASPMAHLWVRGPHRPGHRWLAAPLPGRDWECSCMESDTRPITHCIPDAPAHRAQP